MKFPRSKSKQPARRRSYKWDQSWTKPLGWVLVIYFAYKLVKDGFGGLFDGSMNQLEEAKLALIKKIPVDESKLTITISDAQQRANNIHYAVKGAGTDEKAVIKNLVTAQAQPYVQSYQRSDGVISTAISVAVLGIVGSPSSTVSLKNTYKKYEYMAQLGKNDLNLIAREFGVKSGVNFSGGMKGYYTLAEWINSDLDGEELELVQYIFRNSDVKI